MEFTCSPSVYVGVFPATLLSHSLKRLLRRNHNLSRKYSLRSPFVIWARLQQTPNTLLGADKITVRWMDEWIHIQANTG